MKDLREDEPLFIAMEPILNSDDHPCIFKASMIDEKIVLNAFSVCNDAPLAANAQIVYRVPPQ